MGYVMPNSVVQYLLVSANWPSLGFVLSQVPIHVQIIIARLNIIEGVRCAMCDVRCASRVLSYVVTRCNTTYDTHACKRVSPR